jgi:transcriptional regulator of PTS gene
MDFFSKNIKEINNENRQYAQKRKIVSELIKSDGPMTIPNLCIMLKTSIPKGTKLVNELIEEGILIESGKKETENGRRPVLYKVQPEFAFFIGVIIQLKGISLSVFNMDMQEIFQSEKADFILDNTEKCLQQVVDFIRKGLADFVIPEERLLGIGIGITGRVDSIKGDSYTYFNFPDISLSKYLENELLTRIYIDNDTHVIGLAEQVFGKAKNSKNALIVNLSRGLGMSIEANGEIISGSYGFAGEFGHMQFPDSENKLCLCGKRGCLGTEVSGYALEESFREKIQSGESSLILASGRNSNIQYERILEAAVHGDLLSISLIHDMGFKLGKALGNIVNLLNPEQIIIGGKFTLAEGIIVEAIKSGMVHTTLAQPFRSCTLSVSSIGPKGGGKGAGVLVLRRLGII